MRRFYGIHTYLVTTGLWIAEPGVVVVIAKCVKQNLTPVRVYRFTREKESVTSNTVCAQPFKPIL